MIYKIKPLHTFDAVVVGFIEGGIEKECYEKYVVMMTDKDTYQLVGKIGNGFSDQERTIY